jgi:uncharacterized membrane protein
MRTTWHSKLWGGHPAVEKKLTRGERAADVMKAGLATWIALFGVIFVILFWIQTSGFGHDSSPFILLNLCLSCFAALQCFVLLIANKRGEQIASAIALHTYENTQALQRLMKENTALTKDIKDNTDVLGSIQKQLKLLVKN